MHRTMLLRLLAVFAMMAIAPSTYASLSIEGTTAGTFINPSPSTATTTGVGTSSFTWGIGAPPPPSSLEFTATPFDTFTESEFKVGTLRYYNGTIQGGSGADTVDLKIDLNFTTPPAGTKSFEFTLELINTPNTGNAEDSADFVLLPTLFPTTIFTIDGIPYTLKLLGFRNVVGDGFLESDSTQFHVLENRSASAELWGVVTADLIPGLAVPEPSTWAMGLTGMVLSLGYTLSRRRPARI
ncbi:choice-of-anchor K domain-containing protein [Tautonia rosea]|uniref:choice-of-anchor K domain-containing protein n=1 Tax=Tautonia rosea TaxID=2728037 RepID=UPI001474A577|nr:choice-of-anchor K domain-containing protein [Tautonia rosea]